MKNSAKKLTYFSCSFFLIRSKQTQKIKNILEKIIANMLFSMWKKKKGNLFDLYVSLIEELQKVKTFKQNQFSL